MKHNKIARAVTRTRRGVKRPPGRVAYVDGRFVRHGDAHIHIEDRGLQFGDSVYEVCGIVAGKLTDEPEHLDRLERSLTQIELTMPVSRQVLGILMRTLIRLNRIETGLLYIQVTRGAVHRDHPIPAQVARPTLIMTASAMNPAAIELRRQAGITVITQPDKRWARCDIKTTQLLPNLLAKTAARRAGAYEAWLVDHEGFVTEGTSTTAWIVDEEGTVSTRALSNAILPGVTRRVILEVAAEAQVAIRERSFLPSDALKAREAFISSATGIYPVTAIDGTTIGDGHPGPVTRRIQELYARRSAMRAERPQ